MRPFILERPRTTIDAIGIAGTKPIAEPIADRPAQFLAGGTTLIDLMKLDVMRPEMLIDIAHIAGGDADRITSINGTLRLGAQVKMSDAAAHDAVKKDYPVIAQTLDLAASPQLRNMATLGGNVLQRTRCPYFRDVSYVACNKRNPGSGCSALEGINRAHAVLGTSDACIATYPGDFAQALMALDAKIELAGPKGNTRKDFADLHRSPEDRPHIETSLGTAELILAFEIPATPFAKRSRYVKVRDRQSYEFALASAAVVLDMDGDHVREARIALGGVATRPWRAHSAEELLKGKRLDQAMAEKAAQDAFATASSREHNAYKIPLGKSTLVRALLETAAMEG